MMLHTSAQAPAGEALLMLAAADSQVSRAWAASGSWGQITAPLQVLKTPVLKPQNHQLGHR